MIKLNILTKEEAKKVLSAIPERKSKKVKTNNKEVKMKQTNIGGNPIEDKAEAVERFNRVVKPTLEANGWVMWGSRGHIMYNKELNAVVFVSSCPSQTSTDAAMDTRIRKITKEFKDRGLDTPLIYVYYTRDYSEWASKPWYISSLRRVEKIGRVLGICVGLGKLTKFINKTESREYFRIGIE